MRSDGVQYEDSLYSRHVIDEIAKSTDMKVVFHEYNQLQIDIDDEAGWKYYLSSKKDLDRFYHIVGEEIHPSQSGLPKRHITITLSERVQPFERTILQACLGSDRRREFFSLFRLLHDDPHPTLFVEKKESE